MTELCFKCNKAVVGGCGYYYLGNCFHARCLHCSTCGGKLVGKPFLTCEDKKIFCDEECTRNYVLICDDTANEPPPSITVNYPSNEMYPGSPDEPLFIPTLRSSPVPVGASIRMYRTDSLSSDLSGTSHTSDNSYTHDANKKPKKRILKQPHEKKHDHRRKHVHWRLDEVVDSRFEGDDTSLDSSDTYAKIPDLPGKKYNRGWNETDEVSWKVNLQWNGRSEMMVEDGTPDIDLPFDESYLAEGTSVPPSHHQVQRLPDIPSHQLAISPSDDNATPLLVDRMKEVQLQDTPISLQAAPPQLIDSPIQSAADDQNLSHSVAHLQNTAATLTSTPVVLRKKNGVINANPMPPVLKIRDSMVCELEESVYDGKPNMFQFPDTNCNGSPGTAKKASGDVHQLSPLPEDTASLPAVLKIDDTSQLVENSIKSDFLSQPSNTCFLDKDMMGQSILVTSSLTQEQSTSTSSSCGLSDDTKTLSSNTPTSSFTHTNSDSDLSVIKNFLGKTPNPLNLSSGSTSSLPVFSSYMNQQPKLQDNARTFSTSSYHGSPSNGRHNLSTTSLPTMTNSLDDDIDTPMGESDAASTHKPQAPVVRYKRHYSYGPESFSKVNSPTSSRAKQKLEAIMKDIELEENRGISNNTTRNNSGCGVCHQPVVFESTFMLDGIGYHPSCFVCVACGRSLRGKRICKAKNQLYCEEDFLYHGFRLMQRICDHCNMPIISQDQVEAYTKIFHKQCFQCSECYSPLPCEQDSRLLEGRPVCVKCHLLVMYRQTAPTIRRTAQPIQGCSEML